ncbi:MAG: alpha-amylase family protein [Anaerolineae bacterium]
MQNKTSVSVQKGLCSLALPSSPAGPGVSVCGARIGVQFAGEEPTFSPDWQLVGGGALQGEDRLGAFEGWSARYNVQGKLTVDWSAMVYAARSMVAVSMGITNTSSEDLHVLRLFSLLADPAAGAVVEAPIDASQALILNNASWMPIPEKEWRLPVPEGTFQSGYWSLGLGEPGGKALVAGFGEVTTSWASIGFTRKGRTLGLEMGGWLWSDAKEKPLRLKAGTSFQLQKMLLASANDLHEGLVAYAEAVKTYVDVKLRFPPYAGIFAAYGSDPAGQHPENYPLTEERIVSMRRVLDKYLQPYGLDTYKTQFAGLSSGPVGMTHRREDWTSEPIAPREEGLVDWIEQSAFTPESYDSRVDFPHGIAAHIQDLKAHGYRPALVCRPFLNVRSGPPRYDELAADIFEMTVKRWGYEYLMFDFNSHDYETDDDTHTMAQGIRSRFQAVRDRVGPDVFIEACMVSPGPVIGVADGFRQGSDWRGGTERLLARQTCTRYYYHQRWFQLDHEFFDPQLRPFTWQTQGVMDAIGSLDRVRMWTSYGALTGMSWLTGGVVENTTPERWWVFQRALPVYGPCAKPLDLLVGDPPEQWLLPVETPAGKHQTLGLFNWSNEPREYHLNLDEICGESAGTWLAYEFWGRRTFGPVSTLDVMLPPNSCQVFYLQPAGASPVWLGSDRHVTGAIGLERFAYNEATQTLEGACVGPAGTQQTHDVYVPEGWQPAAVEGAEFEVPQYRVMRLTVALGESGKQRWQVRLAKGQIV